MSDSLVLHVAGKDYTIPSPPMRVGIAIAYVRAGMEARAKSQEPPPTPEGISDEDLAALIRSLDRVALGPAWAQMLADDVPVADADRALRAVVAWVVSKDPEVARAVMDPEAGGSGPKVSTTTAAASTTRRPASTSGTTSRRRKKTD